MRKVVIIGAGHVGSHCGYTLAHSGITDEIVLVDVDKDKAYAQALDIADSVSFCERETVVRSPFLTKSATISAGFVIVTTIPEIL